MGLACELYFLSGAIPVSATDTSTTSNAVVALYFNSMASSDEEGEIIPDYVTNYDLVDYKEEPISFSILPLLWNEDEIPDGLSTQTFLRGSADSGLQQIYKKVIAWKFDLAYALPEIYVLSKDKTWVKLQKPRKRFEDSIKTILTTVHCLHFMKRNPEATKSAVWNQLLKAFSSYEIEPSENDLLDHMPLINEAAVRDKEIAKSEYLTALLLEMAGTSKGLHEENQTTKKFNFIFDAADDDGIDEENEDDDESDGRVLFDSACALCDNGGELLCCEGRCMRSFHATLDAGADSLCESLGYTDAQVEAIQNFLCRNCQYQQHQCFVCGMLGSSNKSSSVEVFPCVSATCGNFYHPKCVAKLLYAGDETRAEEVQKKIAAGESFTCPAHKCFICKQGEDKQVYDLQFAMCRRCPKAYHRKCLPRDIAFEGNADKNIQQRAWNGLLPNRILIYCMNHNIIPQLGTPERNHILFAVVDREKKQLRLKLLPGKEEGAEKRRIKLVAENRSTVSESITETTAVKMQEKVDYASFTGGDSTKNLGQGSSRLAFGSKITDVTMKSLRASNISVQKNVCKPFQTEKRKLSLGNNNSLPSMTPHVFKAKKPDFPSGKTKNTTIAAPAMKKVSNTLPSVDVEMEKRIMLLINKSTASFNMEAFICERKKLSSNACSSRNVVDKTITKGKVKVSVKAVRAALKKLEEGCTIQEAKEICEPQILKEIVRWKKKLRVYLGPFLHGMRYTSFGRHFTKVDKLKEIVDRLHWYVQDGDMIVDFCCGSNDFSWLLKEKLEQMGRSCSFKNYDLIQSKNDFNFEKRDWMSVRPEELPAGSQLIMGLNPPFGVQAALANQFIAQALTFKPKLLILIVPRETKRLDEKNPPYDLVWEDDEILSGKSFYLPGSVDVHDQQMDQWNNETPPLYLWSRPDWTAKHKTIAQQHGHLSKEQEETHAEGKNVETAVSNYLMEENLDCYGDFSNIMNGCSDISRILDDVPEDYEHDGGGADVTDDHSYSISSDELDRMLDEALQGTAQSETSQKGNLSSGEPLQVGEMDVDMELSSPTDSPGYNRVPKSLSEYQPSAAFGTGRQDLLQPSVSGTPSEFGTEYATFHPTTVPNAINWGLRQRYEGAAFNVPQNGSTNTNYDFK